MSSFFWNIRGFNKSTKHLVVREWVKKGMMLFGGLLETRVKEKSQRRLSLKFSRTGQCYRTTTPIAWGRIWVVWSPQVRITPVFTSTQMITCSVLLDSSQEEFFCSFVYASNFVEDRKLLWEDIQSHQKSPLFRN